jgi:hypothetical protein
MEEEWIKFLRENHPALYEQMKKSVWWQYEWRDNKLTAQAELIDSLQAALAESEARVARLLGEEKRLREALVKISEWGCNGQCVELCGTKCPCCLAEEALGGAE